MRYARHVSTKSTPQTEPIPGTAQKRNNAGGYAWAVDDWTRLDRFLILGSEKGTYYVKERKLTQDNAACVQRCLAADFKRTVDRIVDVSVSGRAPKQDPALFALALACRAPQTEARQYARAAIPKVARIGTHLFHLVDALNETGGWGRGTRQAIARWYTGMELDDLAYQLVKYPSRDSWSHRDVLRLAHPKADAARSAMLKWAVAKEPWTWEPGAVPGWKEPMARLWARDTAMKLDAGKPEERAALIKLIADYRLPRECLPTEALNHADVWEALLVDMPVTALVRNLGKMSAVGLLKPLSAAAKAVVARLGDAERLRKARLHPLQVLVAQNTYRGGHGIKGSLSWTPVPQVVDALDDAFYATFKTIEPSGKRNLLGIDCSGSMSGPEIAGMTGISPRLGAAVMAMVTARCEPEYHFVGFCHRLVDLPISARMRLDDVVRIISRADFGATDCSVPMLHAQREGLDVDVFAVYTDSETYAGSAHPAQALRNYRERKSIDAKLVVVGMTATEFTIADPNDRGMMDVAGFDTAAPGVIADFTRT